jgi:hypothetical protein
LPDAGGTDDLVPTLAFSVDIGLCFACLAADGCIAERAELLPTSGEKIRHERSAW